MAILEKKQLLHKVVESIKDCGWNVVCDVSKHPYRLSIYSNDEVYKLKIFIWNLSHGGGSKRPENEYRIQVKVKKPFIEELDCITLLLGWWDSLGVFAGFDIQKHLGLPGWSSSIQIKEVTLREAFEYGFSVSDKGNQEIAVAFRPDFFVEYVQDIRGYHNFGKSRKDLSELKRVVKNLEINEQEIEITNLKRKNVAITLKRKLRDISFRSRVLTAYGFKCAICGVQLKLVEAAHIIPVHKNGTDETSNGLSLCSLHHKAYDKGLITVIGNYSIVINKEQINQLKSLNLLNGFKDFRRILRPMIHIPPALSDRPHRGYIKRSNKIRGW